MDWQERTRRLLGDEDLERLANSHVLIAGVGGVGSSCAESLTRAGIGTLTLIDTDEICITNINRQIPALHSTVGKKKALVMAERLKDINPELKVNVYDDYVIDEKVEYYLTLHHYDFVVDAIDTLKPKVQLIEQGLEMGLEMVSAMGAGGKTDASKAQISKLAKTHQCGLALAVRKRLRPAFQRRLHVVFSPESIDKSRLEIRSGMDNKRSIIGTIAYMPAIFGHFCASVAIRQLLNRK